MALDQENVSTGAAPNPEAAAATGGAGMHVPPGMTPPPGQAPGGQSPYGQQQQAQGLDIYAQLLAMGSYGIAPQHKKYNEEIMDEAKKFIPNLELMPLQSPPGAQAFITKGEGNVHYAKIVLFESLIPQMQDLRPVSDRLREAQESLAKAMGGKTVHIIGSQIISDRDLTLVPQMILSTSSDLIASSRVDIREANSRALSAGYDWVVDPNVTSALDLISRLSPVKTLPRADFGFTLGVRQQGKNNQYANGFMQQQNAPVDPIIACVGYTEIIGPIADRQSGISKFLPIVHISATVSRVPTLAAELLAVVQMTQMAIVNQGWKIPFRKFQEGKPNLGNLRIDPQDQNKLWFINNPDMFERFVADQFFPPVLYMDVQEGAYRIPSRLLFAGDNPSHLGRIANEASRFFGAPFLGLKGPLPLAMTVAQEYTGTFGSDVKTDSREITYLNRVCQGALDKQSADILLNYQNDPSERARVVANLTGSFTSLYRNRLSWISPEFIGQLSGMVRQSRMRIYDPTAQAGTVPLAGFIQAGADFTGFQPYAYQRQGSTMDGLGGYNI